MQERILEALQSSAPLVVADIPLLFERDRDEASTGPCWCTRRQRSSCSGSASATASTTPARGAALAAQLPIDEKRARATWVIDNGGSRESTAAQVDAWWHEVVAGA